MRIAFNALSATYLSGQHVLCGHLREIIRANIGRHLLLTHRANKEIVATIGSAVDVYECPSYTSQWALRGIWERFKLAKVLHRERVDVLFSPAGVTIPGLKIPQLVLTQNPWCFVPSIQNGQGDRIKASLQRLAYRHAQQEAAVMLYNSKYMKDLYDENAGKAAKSSLILHQGIDDSTFSAARSILNFQDRKLSILALSAMAPHKCIEDILAAVSILHIRGLRVALDLVGPWPSPRYLRMIQRQIRDLKIHNLVNIHGRVDNNMRDEFYRTSRAFCLLSRCESFGIPSIEAQAFGTPSVVAACGAAPEIAGPGGFVVVPGNPEQAADALLPLLTDPNAWEEASRRAVQNARRFRWQSCSSPLVSLLTPS